MSVTLTPEGLDRPEISIRKTKTGGEPVYSITAGGANYYYHTHEVEQFAKNLTELLNTNQ